MVAPAHVLDPFRIIFGPPADAKNAFARRRIVGNHTSPWQTLRGEIIVKTT